MDTRVETTVELDGRRATSDLDEIVRDGEPDTEAHFRVTPKIGFTLDEPGRPMRNTVASELPVSRGVLVLHDGSERSERALSDAVAICTERHVPLGLAILRPPAFLQFWSFACGAGPPPAHAACSRVLRLIPDDLSLRYLYWPSAVGNREIAEFAARLECDIVLMPRSRAYGRRTAKALSRRGYRVVPSW